MFEKIKKAWEWCKDNAFGFGILLGGLLFLCRCLADRRGSDSVEDFIDRSKKLTGEAEGKNTELGGKLEECEDLADGIADDNRDAEAGIDEALGILDRAEERAEVEESCRCSEDGSCRCISGTCRI